MTDKTIIRKEKGKTNPYTLISRKSLQNPALSWKAKGMLAYLLSLPDNWQVYIKELPKHCKDGIKSTRRAFKELQAIGHISGQKRRNEKGQYLGFEYVVHEVALKAVEKPETLVNQASHPRAQKRHAVKGTLLNTNLTADETEPLITIRVNDRSAMQAMEGLPVSQDVFISEQW